MNKQPVELVLTGLSVMGSAFPINTPAAAQTATFILTGQYDLELRHAFFCRIHSRPALPDEEVKTPEVEELFERFKRLLRNGIQNIFDEADRQEAREMQQKFENLRDSLKQSHKPHAQGTVAELAILLGVSKSEVRRLKQDGQLDAAIAAATAKEA